MKKYNSDFVDRSKLILRKVATSYAKTASLYVPPGDGKGKKLGAKTIPRYMYFRRIKYLPDEVRDSKNIMKDKDKEQLHKGMLYKVVSKKRNKTTVWYFKSIRKAKKYMKIQNRGLFKVSFGSALEKIGEIIPSMIRSLMNKSKNLFNLKSLNKIIETKDDSGAKIIVGNNAYNNESFASIAIRQGEYAASKTLKSELKKIAKENIEV